jgi:hypothetical protein
MPPTTLADNFAIKWHDESQNVIFCEIYSLWTWDDAYHMARAIRTLCQSVTHEVAVIVYFHPAASVLPIGSLRTHLRNVVTGELPNVQLAILVGAQVYLSTLTFLAEKVCRASELLARVRFVNTLDAAFAQIQSSSRVSSIQ